MISGGESGVPRWPGRPRRGRAWGRGARPLVGDPAARYLFQAGRLREHGFRPARHRAAPGGRSRSSIVAPVGDRSLGMSLAELETLARVA
jgi:hypothetical protein